MDLLLIRHARPEHVETRDGSPADPPLDETGRAQAARLGEWLADEKLDAVYVSPLRRARQTAEPLLAARALEPVVEPRVAEFDQLSDTYIPLEKLKEQDYERWLAFVRGGYGEGIDFEAFCAGAIAGIERIVGDHPGARVAIVCHGGVINVWTAHVLGMEPRLFFEPYYASVHRYLAARSGQKSVVTLNELPR